MPELKDLKLSPLVASILYHAVVMGAIVYFTLHQLPEDGQNVQPIQIESINEAKPKLTRFQRKTQEVHQNNGERTAKSIGNSHRVSLSDLGMRLDTSERPSQESSNLPTQTENNTYDTPDLGGWDLMNPDPRVARFNQYVYNVVQGWLDRDSSQNTQVLTGTVKIRVWFDGDGNYLENETNYDAIDPQFQKIVERALKKSFSRPIPHPFLYTHKKFSIDRMVVLRPY